MPSQLYKYETDAGQILRIRMSTEKKAVGGAEPSGTLTDNRLRVSAGGSRRQFNSLVAGGRVYSRFETTAGGLKAIQSVFIPILLKADRDSVAPATINYKGKDDWKFVDIQAED